VTDASGNPSSLLPVSSFTIDTTPPVVTLTAPTDATTVSGTIAISATATDSLGVAGVQFTIDGSNVSSEDMSDPYSIAWNSAMVANGMHTVGAVARDMAGNTTTASTVSVTVSNTVVSTSSSHKKGGHHKKKKKKRGISGKIIYKPGERVKPFITLITPRVGTLTDKSLSYQASSSDRSGIQAMFVIVNGTKKKRTNGGYIAYTAKKQTNATLNVTAYDSLGNVKTAVITIVNSRVVGVRYY
jgi:hypothetical protein